MTNPRIISLDDKPSIEDELKKLDMLIKADDFDEKVFKAIYSYLKAESTTYFEIKKIKIQLLLNEKINLESEPLSKQIPIVRKRSSEIDCPLSICLRKNTAAEIKKYPMILNKEKTFFEYKLNKKRNAKSSKYYYEAMFDDNTEKLLSEKFPALVKLFQEAKAAQTNSDEPIQIFKRKHSTVQQTSNETPMKEQKKESPPQPAFFTVNYLIIEAHQVLTALRHDLKEAKDDKNTNPEIITTIEKCISDLINTMTRQDFMIIHSQVNTIRELKIKNYVDDINNFVISKK